MTGKNTIKILLTFLIPLTCTVYGQTKKIHERDTTKKWIVGTDLLWLINKNQLPPINLQVKRVISSKLNLFARVRTGFDYYKRDSTYFFGAPLPGPFIETKKNYLIRIGVEKHKKITPKFIFYYGLDLALEKRRTDYEKTKNTFIADQWEFVLFVGTDQLASYSMVPFTGLRYKLNRSINFSFESSLQAGVVRYKSEYSAYTFPVPQNYDDLMPEQYGDSKITFLKIIPIQFLSIEITIN
jgi:hypothetical protein